MVTNSTPNTDFNHRLQRARDLFETGEYESSSFLYHQLIDDAKGTDIQVFELWVELAWAYYNMKRFESTIICLKQVIEHPQDYEKMVDVFRLAGMCHFHLGRLKKAIDHYEQALRIMALTDPDRRFLLYDIGQVHFQRGEYPIAKKYFDEARTLFEYEESDEDLARLSYSLGFCEYYLQEYANALQLFEDTWTISESNTLKALALYGQAFVQLNYSNYEKLIELVNQVSVLDPDFEDKETLAYLLCRSYKGLQDRVHFELFFKELKKNYPEGKYTAYYDELERW